MPLYPPLSPDASRRLPHTHDCLRTWRMLQPLLERILHEPLPDGDVEIFLRADLALAQLERVLLAGRVWELKKEPSGLSLEAVIGAQRVTHSALVAIRARMAKAEPTDLQWGALSVGFRAYQVASAMIQRMAWLRIVYKELHLGISPEDVSAAVLGRQQSPATPFEAVRELHEASLMRRQALDD